MPQASYCEYIPAGIDTIAAGTKLLEKMHGGLAVRGLSVYTPTTDPTYTKDLVAQVLHLPNFPIEDLEESKEMLTDVLDRQQWWVANIGRLVYPTLTRINGKPDEDLSTDPLFAAIPKFPDVPVTPSSLTGKKSIETSFHRSRISSGPMALMCEVGYDDESVAKNMYTVLKPQAIICLARRVLNMPVETLKQHEARYNLAMDVFSCASAVLRNLEVFDSEKLTQPQFQELLVEHGPFLATSLDLKSLQVKEIVKKATASGVDFTTISHMESAQRKCWFVGRLLTEWMNVVRVLMLEACCELDDYLTELEHCEDRLRKEKKARSKRQKRPSVSSFYTRAILPSNYTYAEYGPMKSSARTSIVVEAQAYSDQYWNRLYPPPSKSYGYNDPYRAVEFRKPTYSSSRGFTGSPQYSRTEKSFY